MLDYVLPLYTVFKQLDLDLRKFHLPFERGTSHMQMLDMGSVRIFLALLLYFKMHFISSCDEHTNIKKDLVSGYYF